MIKIEYANAGHVCAKNAKSQADISLLPSYFKDFSLVSCMKMNPGFD